MKRRKWIIDLKSRQSEISHNIQLMFVNLKKKTLLAFKRDQPFLLISKLEHRLTA